jgi:hypothetical protein
MIGQSVEEEDIEPFKYMLEVYTIFFPFSENF